MPSQETLYNVADRGATITLNRPDKLDAWTAVLEQEVRSAEEEAERDDHVRVMKRYVYGAMFQTLAEAFETS